MEFIFTCLLLMKESKGIEMILWKLSKGIRKRKNFLYKFYLIRNSMDGLWTKLLKLLGKLTIAHIAEF